MEFSTATPPALHSLRDNPAGLKEYVKEVVEAAHDPSPPTGRFPQLEELYFEVGAERACALVRDLDDYIWAKAVTRILGVDKVTKLLDVDQMTDAIAKEQTIRPQEVTT